MKMTLKNRKAFSFTLKNCCSWGLKELRSLKLSESLVETLIKRQFFDSVKERCHYGKKRG